MRQGIGSPGDTAAPVLVSHYEWMRTIGWLSNNRCQIELLTTETALPGDLGSDAPLRVVPTNGIRTFGVMPIF